MNNKLYIFGMHLIEHVSNKRLVRVYTKSNINHIPFDLCMSIDRLLEAFVDQIWSFAFVVASHKFTHVHGLQRIAPLIFVRKSFGSPSCIYISVKIVKMRSFHETMHSALDFGRWNVGKVCVLNAFQFFRFDRMCSHARSNMMLTINDGILFWLINNYSIMRLVIILFCVNKYLPEHQQSRMPSKPTQPISSSCFRYEFFWCGLFREPVFYIKFGIERRSPPCRFSIHFQ